MRYLLKNGTVVSGEKSMKADVLTDGEKILAVGNGVLSACPIKELPDGAPGTAVPDADVKKSARTGCCQQQSRENKQKCMK